MISPKSMLLFVSGCGAGVLLTVALLNPASRASAATSVNGPFKDVPANHAAAAAVASLKSKGILKGYDDGTYHGDKPVTRYELAVTLARFAQYYDTSKQPLATSGVAIPSAPAWVQPSREYLASNFFVVAQSPIYQSPGTAPVASEDFADALSSLLDRINDRVLPLTTN